MILTNFHKHLKLYPNTTFLEIFFKKDSYKSFTNFLLICHSKRQAKARLRIFFIFGLSWALL